MDTEKIVAITQLINSYGHIADEAETGRLSEIFTADATFDQRPVGGVLQDGLEAIRTFFELPIGPKRPNLGLGHHSTNIYIWEENGAVRVKSKLLVIDVKSRVHTGVYEDRVVLDDGKWKIAERVVRVNRPPKRDAQS